MKKSLWSGLVLVMVCFSSMAFAAPVSYTTEFDSMTGWVVKEGGWQLAPTPEPGNMVYYGIPGADTGVASSYLWQPNDFGMVSTNGLRSGVVFGMPDDGAVVGAFYGAYDNGNGDSNSHSFWLYRNNGNLFFGYNTFAETSDVDAPLVSLGMIGDKSSGADFDEDDIFLLTLEFDINNDLTWAVVVRNTQGEYDDPAIGGQDDVALIPELTGVMGVFTKGGANWFGYFGASYDDGSPVPVPGTMVLLGAGLLSLTGLRRKEK